MKHNGLKRFAAIYAVSLLAVGMSQPDKGNAFVLGGALVPALIGWLIVRRKPSSLLRAIIRGGAVALLFCGFAALGNAHDVGEQAGLSPDAIDQTVFSGWAGAFFALGLIGLFGSLFGERHRKDANAAD